VSVLVTGAAGFIGSHVCQALLAQGEQVHGVDNLNAYYDPALKRARLARIEERTAFTFHPADIADAKAMAAAAAAAKPLRAVVHFAAQAGVRHSVEHPMDYVRSNIAGQLVVLEMCRAADGLEHLVYASSSSVYGGNTKQPFAITDRVDTPISLYAATKRAGELMGHTYAHLFRIPSTGLRFFTVYGPWGRPDMATYIFTKAIFEGRPIAVYNHGDMRRDFTYIDDIVDGVLRVLARPPADDGSNAPHRLYNIGNNTPEALLRFIGLIEQALGKTAEKILLPIQPGDVPENYADIGDMRRDTGFVPRTAIDEGIPRFVEWYREYHGT
jgi:UDP-glucuronate 4-epimerase